MEVIKAPNWFPPTASRGPILFLAGSIEMGEAEDWQTRVVTQLLHGLPGIILNPRRDDWDATWVQSIDNPQFHEQVAWELEGLRTANLVAFYFAPGTKSPITLMELGLCAHRGGANQVGDLIVCCPHGFWRRGNIEVVCQQYHIELYDDVEKWMQQIRDRVHFRDALKTYQEHIDRLSCGGLLGKKYEGPY